jgi:dTDP-4-dehydrorhamnose 3,5-epimerase
MRTQVISLEKNYSRDKKSKETNGYVISLWKDWEKILPYEPKQVYVNVCYPGQIKGPHLHKQRCGQFACIKGKGRFTVRYAENDYEYIDVNADSNPCIVVIPPGIPSSIKNTGDDLFVILNMPNPAWHPQNLDDWPVEFNDNNPEKEI